MSPSWEDVEAYIRAIPWTDAATDHDKLLVAGNLRAYAAGLRAESAIVHETLRDVLAWIDEVGAEAKRRDTERLAPARALIAKADAEGL